MADSEQSSGAACDAPASAPAKTQKLPVKRVRQGKSGKGAPSIPAQRGEMRVDPPLRDQNGRFARHRQLEPLPDLAAAMAQVPGGLGVALPSEFEFAGVKWTLADAAFDGSPIGFQLAFELAHGVRKASSETPATSHSEATRSLPGKPAPDSPVTPPANLPGDTGTDSPAQPPTTPAAVPTDSPTTTTAAIPADSPTTATAVPHDSPTAPNPVTGSAPAALGGAATTTSDDLPGGSAVALNPPAPNTPAPNTPAPNTPASNTTALDATALAESRRTARASALPSSPTASGAPEPRRGKSRATPASGTSGRRLPRRARATPAPESGTRPAKSTAPPPTGPVVDPSVAAATVRLPAPSTPATEPVPKPDDATPTAS